MPGMTTECAGRRCPAGGAGGRAEEPLPAVQPGCRTPPDYGRSASRSRRRSSVL